MLVVTDKLEVTDINEPKTPEHSEPEIELKNNNAEKTKRQPTVLQEEVEKAKNNHEDKNTAEAKESDSQSKKRKLEEDAESEQKAKKIKLDTEETNHVCPVSLMITKLGNVDNLKSNRSRRSKEFYPKWLKGKSK